MRRQMVTTMYNNKYYLSGDCRILDALIGQGCLYNHSAWGDYSNLCCLCTKSNTDSEKHWVNLRKTDLRNLCLYFWINYFKVRFKSFDCLMAKKSFIHFSLNGKADMSEQNDNHQSCFRPNLLER